MLGLRKKLSLGFGGLLIIMMIIGFQSIRQLQRLGGSIDVILRENYRSVIACQKMNETLERADSGALFVLLGEEEKGSSLIAENLLGFREALQIEMSNITLPEESEKAGKIKDMFARYEEVGPAIRDSKIPFAERRNVYFDALIPLFNGIKTETAGILAMNQQNMIDANDRARSIAASSRKKMLLLLSVGIVVAFGFLILTGKWILHPIRRLIRSADDIRRGNLDLVLTAHSRDEIGQLSEAFNAMTASLREFRRTDQAKLLMIQRATQQAFNSLPEAAAVVDPDGNIEVATEPAKMIFGLLPGLRLIDSPLKDMVDLFKEAFQSGRRVVREDNAPLQQFVKGEERYFRPEAVPILDRERLTTGVILVLQDITQLQQQNEIKQGVIRTVSHQLKTPLTSIRMAIHILLEEKLGPLTEKQAELLMTAQEDSERLNGILAGLLDISRLESGKARLDLKPESPRAIVKDILELQRRNAQDLGIQLEVEVGDDLPDVLVDSRRIRHVFENLITNALSYTPPGGRITIGAREEKDAVRFSITDTGTGIPERFLPRIFEPFFRVPGRGSVQGAGLGLAIVKEIVEAHGGAVEAESRENRGTTFRFSLLKTATTKGEKE